MSTSILEALARLNALVRMCCAYETAVSQAANEYGISAQSLDAAFRNQP